MSTYSRGYHAARIGILGIIATAVFFGLFLYVTNRGLAMRRSDIYVRMNNASGLKKGDPVVYRGVTVGEVRKLIFAESGDVLVRAKLLEPLPLTTEARAELVPVDLFGRQSLVLRDGDRFAPRLASSDTVEGLPPVTIATRMSDLGNRAERLLSDSMVALLEATLRGSKAATEQVAVLSASMDRLVRGQHANLTMLTENAANLARNLNKATSPADLSAVQNNLVHATARLDSVTVSLAALMNGMERGEGSAGKLLRDDAMYDRTTALLASLEELARDVKANPKRYINVKVF
jgi:phospholipid/cholesterol/gamma-HCH transport system substrate-binding protein